MRKGFLSFAGAGADSRQIEMFVALESQGLGGGDADGPRSTLPALPNELPYAYTPRNGEGAKAPPRILRTSNTNDRSSLTALPPLYKLRATCTQRCMRCPSPTCSVPNR